MDSFVVCHVIRNQGSLKSWRNFAVTKTIQFYTDVCVFSMYDCVLKSMWFSLELHTISACLRFICCFRTVAVHRREWKWKASIFIQCLCGADRVGRLNACHIDTPVVSPVGPQRHNGVGSARLCVPRCSCLCLFALGCWFCYLLTLQCWWFFVISSNEISDWESRIYEVRVKCSQVLILRLLKYCTYEQFWSTCVLPLFIFYYFKLLLHCLLDANNVLCALICRWGGANAF